jgi:putative DNA primase/helicase
LLFHLYNLYLLLSHPHLNHLFSIFSANQLPAVNIDYAFYRRWILVHFPNNFEENKDPDLINKLTTDQELSGLLNLALEGLKRLRENGKFSNIKPVENTQKEYALNSDHVLAFLDECTLISETNTTKDDMYYAYGHWCCLNGIDPLPENTFCKKMSKLGIKRYRRNINELNGRQRKQSEFVGIDFNLDYLILVEEYQRSIQYLKI